jgi:hypothetical protein
MAVKRMGMLGVSVREMRLLAVKVERATVTGNWKYSESDMLRVLSV